MSPAAAVLLLALAAPSPGTAPGSDERLRKVRERREALQRELDRLRADERSLLGDLERLDVAVRLRREELHEVQIVLQRTNERMDATLRRVGELEASLAEARPVLATRARALYKLGELSYLRLLLSVERPSDLFRGYRFVAALARRDRQRIAAFRADLTALAATRLELEQRTREALTLRTGVERARRNLEADRRRKAELLTSILQEKDTHAAYVGELEEAESKLQQLVGGLGEGEVSVPMAAFKGSLPWPAVGRVRSGFGRRKHPRFDTYTLQNGVEIEAPPGGPVSAVHEGTVVFAERFRGYGLMVVVDHGSKHHSLYAHLAETRVVSGQRVAAGDVLGTAGTTGIEGAGLYFEMRHHGKPEDPLDWLGKADGRPEGR